jgi:hypothetical protein
MVKQARLYRNEGGRLASGSFPSQGHQLSTSPTMNPSINNISSDLEHPDELDDGSPAPDAGWLQQGDVQQGSSVNFGSEPPPLPDKFDNGLPDPGCQAQQQQDDIQQDLGANFGQQSAPAPQEDIPAGVGMNLDELSDIAQLKDMTQSMAFICALEVASLDDEDVKLSPEALERLRNLPQQPVDVIDPDLHLSLDLFLSISNASQGTYSSIREAILHRHPEDEILSYDQIKCQVAELRGITPLVHHMCPNSCLAYTGPYSGLDKCPICGEDRYDQIKLAASGGKTQVAHQEYHTLPLGPQLQALWQDKDSADKMCYRKQYTKDILEELEQNRGVLGSYSDFFDGSDYLNALTEGRIKSGDMLLMLSIDGAQLYASKASDCWIYMYLGHL